MSVTLYRAQLANGTTKRVRVDTIPLGFVVEGDRYILGVSVAEAVAAYGRSRGWDVVGVTAPPGAR